MQIQNFTGSDMMMGTDIRVLHAFLFFLLLLSGDVESNPGPPKKGKMFDIVAIVHTLLDP